jgi:hypothetical protein
MVRAARAFIPGQTASEVSIVIDASTGVRGKSRPARCGGDKSEIYPHEAIVSESYPRPPKPRLDCIRNKIL